MLTITKVVDADRTEINVEWKLGKWATTALLLVLIYLTYFVFATPSTPGSLGCAEIEAAALEL